MESSASARQVPRSDSAVKIVNSFRDLLTSVLEVLSTPLTVAVIVVVSLIAFNDYERWGNRRDGPQNASALQHEILAACRARDTVLWKCVGLTKRALTR